MTTFMSYDYRASNDYRTHVSTDYKCASLLYSQLISVPVAHSDKLGYPQVPGSIPAETPST